MPIENRGSLKDKVIFITGSTRGIGREIALLAAQEGAIIIVSGKTAEPHAALPGTIYTVAKEVEEAGGKAIPIALDVRDELQIQAAVQKIISTLGRIDILVNNASAISLSATLETPMKRFDLMMSVNMRATFACSQACLPYLQQSENPHILMLSPPLNMAPKWFSPHLAYTMSKYGMSMCVLGLSEEFREKGVAVNALWPKTTIATSAIAVHFPKEMLQASRKPAIVADAAHWILTQDSQKVTGHFFIDEEILRAQGIEDFTPYSLDSTKPVFSDLFL